MFIVFLSYQVRCLSLALAILKHEKTRRLWIACKAYPFVNKLPSLTINRVVCISLGSVEKQNNFNLLNQGTLDEESLYENATAKLSFYRTFFQRIHVVITSLSCG